MDLGKLVEIGQAMRDVPSAQAPYTATLVAGGHAPGAYTTLGFTHCR